VGSFFADNNRIVSIRKLRMSHWQFSIRKGGIFRLDKEIEVLRGGVHRYAAQANPKIDAAKAEKDPFRTETRIVSTWLPEGRSLMPPGPPILFSPPVHRNREASRAACGFIRKSI